MYYRIDYRDEHGQRQRETLPPGSSRRDAGRLEKQRRGEAWELRRVLGDPSRRERIRFAAFAERFLGEYKGRGGSCYYRDQLKAAGPIVSYFGEFWLDEIRPKNLDAFKHKRLIKVGPSTVRKNLILLGTMFKHAKRSELIDVKPTDDLKKPSEPKHRTRFLSPEEWAGLEAAAPSWLRPLLAFAVATGMRLKEITGLCWDDVDRKAGLVHVAEETETGTRAVPLGRMATDVLDGLGRFGRGRFVFVDSTGEPYHDRATRNGISKRATALMRSVGLAGATFGTLRHTAASWMVQGGARLEEVRAILGHTTMQTTLRYAHLQPEHLRESIRAIDRVAAN